MLTSSQAKCSRILHYEKACSLSEEVFVVYLILVFIQLLKLISRKG